MKEDKKIILFTKTGKLVKHGPNTTKRYGCRCDICLNARKDYSKKYNRKNIEKIRKRQREIYSKNKILIRQRQNEWYKKHVGENPGIYKEKSWRNKGLKITLEEYKDMMKKQNNKCAICEKELEFNGRLTHVDHDHKTGLIRGVLCQDCNHGIGNFKDSTSLLLLATKYLEKYQETKEGILDRKIEFIVKEI